MLRSFLCPEVADGGERRADDFCATDTTKHKSAEAQAGAVFVSTLGAAQQSLPKYTGSLQSVVAPVSSTYKMSSILFPEAYPAAFEPKVQALYVHQRGGVPRSVEIERRRRQFDEHNLAHLVEVSGLTLADVAQQSKYKLALDIFDDTSFDCRNPSEWMSIAAGNPNAAGRFLPAQGIYCDADGTFTWRPCRVSSWDEARNKLHLKWGAESSPSDDRVDVLPRIFVRFYAEDPITFVRRLVTAHHHREKVTSWIMYRLCCDSMPVEEMSGMDEGLISRLKALGITSAAAAATASSTSADKPEDSNATEQLETLIAEMNLEWKRCHNRILLQDRMKHDDKVLRMVARTTQMNLEELTRGPNITVSRSALGNPNAIIPLDFAGTDFATRERTFTFSTYFTRPEVVAAITGVRRQCIQVRQKSLFVLPKERQMPLEEFQRRQREHMEAMTQYLQDEWIQNICEVISESFKSVGKGWLNVTESKQDVYEMSKLKKFFTTVKFMMEETLFDLVYASLQAFTDFFREFSEFTVDVVDMNTVRNAWPGSDAADCVEKQPLFTINLVEQADRFAYSISKEDFVRTVVDLFDAAIACTKAVPQAEKYVMSQFLWSREGDGPFLDSVKLGEERVGLLREELRDSVWSSLEPLQTYLETYDELLPLVRLDKDTFITEYAAQEPSLEDMRGAITQHLKSKKLVAERIPPFLTVGNFVVDCQSFSFGMAKKEEDLAKLIMRLISKRAKQQTAYICEEFNKIVRVVEKQPQNPEKLYELYDFINNMGERVGELAELIDEVRQYHSLLDNFQFELGDDESRQKWEAIGWPRQLARRTQAARKNLEQVNEELHARMQKGQEEFAQRVEQIQRVVATFSKYTDASAADKVAAEVKTRNLEIRQCIAEARAFNSDQRLFGDRLTDYRNVFELDKEFKPYSDLWLTTHTWQESYRRWHSDAFDSLDPEEIETTVTSAFKTMTHLAKTFKDKTATLKIVEDIRNSVEEFKPWVPLITSLRHPGMAERHWKGLSEKLNMTLAPGTTILLLEDCKPLLEHKEEVVSFCEGAAKESQIEKCLKDMRGRLETKDFSIEPYKDSGTFVLKETVEIVEILDEQLNLTQQLQFSPFKAHFEEAIMDWDRSLNLIAEVLEQWVECQRAWRYLEPIFNSDDITRQLPKLSKLFEKVDKTWRRVMGNAHHQRNVLEFCIGTNKLLDQLREANRLLEEVQRGLNDYLAEKRQAFPRFYFLSDEELLEILSQSKEVRRIDANIFKLFEFIHHLEWNESNQITGYHSTEGEYVAAVDPVTPEGNVEVWLKSVEGMMKAAVHQQVRLAVEDYTRSPRNQWVVAWPAQAVIAVAQIFWTNACEESLASHGNVDLLAGQLEKQLFELVDVVQSPLTPVQRINMGALITIEVHAKDTVDSMRQHGVSSASSFDWMKQLRFYFDPDDAMCHIRQVDAHFVYGGEYLGNTGRLVVTPLTDRIYLTLTGALALCLGGAPAGPAGTGKTETTKDLAKALAKQCVVFNCQEGMTYLSMAKFFKGLAWTGAWACFDEFNRIDVEVLSVVAQQVTDLQQACTTRQYRILFEESDVIVDPTHAVFITMNPGYAGRTELPDNLKVLFRPVACMVPDYAMIGEIRLFSYGYKRARVLAQKMVMSFKLSSEQLSSQDHYDFGMRAVNTVISSAGVNKRLHPDVDEDVLLLRALRDSNEPKFLKDDIALFEGIVSDIFPGTEVHASDHGKVVAALHQAITQSNLQPVPAFIEKCLQLFEITTLRHGLMLVGPAGGGKTATSSVLQAALTACAAAEGPPQSNEPRQFSKVYTHICNPKAVSMEQLYGAYDENGEWKDGILCVLFRRAAKYGDEGNEVGKHWVMFDGPVDALWIESMNTVLDENKKLCLVSGEIIQMNRDMTMMFEVEDLAVASPATVSRCGMIYLDPVTCVPTAASIETWAATLPHYMASQKAALAQLAALYLEELVQFVHESLVEYVASTRSGLTYSFFHMMQGFVSSFEVPKAPPGQSPLSPERLAALEKAIKPLFFFSLVWSVGASCDDESRPRFDAKLRQMASTNGHSHLLPEEGTSLFDCCCDYEVSPAEGEGGVVRWVHWKDTSPPFEVLRGMRFEDIIVPTIDNIRQNYVLRHLMQQKVNVAAVGPTGTGKSVAVLRLVLGGAMPSSFLGLNFTFSAQTKASVLQASMMSKFDKRRSHVFGAPAGKHLLLFIDDANLPQPEKYGAQPPLELLRQLLGQGGFYSVSSGARWNTIVDTSLVLAMGPPGGGRSRVSNRLMRYFNYVAFPEMSAESRRDILNTIVTGGFAHRGMSEETVAMGKQLVERTLSIFSKCCKTFLPTPAHVHYAFNMRDVVSVFPMIYQADPKGIPSTESLVKLWMHELQRVFGDRLINESDKSTLTKLLNEELEALGLQTTYEALVPSRRLIFGDFLAQDGVYREVSDIDALTARFNDLLTSYNEENETRMELVLFSDAVEHICRIARVLRLANGHCLLLGIGGSGRKSLTRLACQLLPDMEVFTVEVTKGFGVKEWRESLALLLLDCGKNDKKRTFLFSDTQLVKPEFLEDVAGLLTSGDVPNLFEDQDIELINEKFRAVCVEENLPTTKVSVYARFVKEVRSNLHIVLAFSPIGEVFRTRMRMFPSLIACCTIDWFAEWPAEALLSVAKVQLNGVTSGVAATDADELVLISECAESFHLDAAEIAELFFAETRRRTYVTPTSYLSLLHNFKAMVDDRRKFFSGQVSRLENGLDKLRDAEEQVVALEAQLKAQQPVLEAKKSEIKAIMARLEVDRKNAAEKEFDARRDENAASAKAEECSVMRRECAERLAEAEPALAEAVKVLSKIKAAEISELNKYLNPPKGVQYVMEAVAVLLTFGSCPKEFFTGPPGGKRTPDWWLCAKSYMKDANRLLEILVQPPEKGGFNREAMTLPLMDKVKTYYENEEFQPEKVKSVSLPCMAMCLWVRAMYNWFFVNREIQPLREKLTAAEEELARVADALRQTRATLDEVVSAVAALEREYTGAIDAQTALENEIDKTTQKLQRAARLIDGLGGEKVRWTDLVRQYKQQGMHVVGDMLIAAATTAYCGPLTSPYRKQLSERWLRKLAELGILTSERVDLATTVGDPVKIQQWQLCGLPKDSLSVENALILSNSRNWPLLIDPQGQANAWIRSIHKNDNLQICKASSDRFMKTIENAIRLGLPCLLENVGDTLEAALEPVLLKNIFLIGSTPHVRVGDSAIPYDTNFRFYMTTKLPNPSYSPEVIVMVSLLNFFITPSGLEDQLLGRTVEKERRDLEQEKQRLTRESAEHNRELKALQSSILHLLETAEGDLLEQEELILTLEKSKTKSSEIGTALLKAEETAMIIDDTRDKYRPHAERGALLFFCVARLSTLDPMYQFSLQWFIHLFLSAVDNAEAADSVEQRVANLADYFTYAFYCNVCRSLFDRHKLTFSFYLCCSMMEKQGEIDEEEYRYFLTGPTGSGGDAPNPAATWLTDGSWNEVQFISGHLPHFAGFAEHVARHCEHYKQLFDSSTADSFPLAAEWKEKATPLQRLIITRCFRRDKVVPAIQQFIRHFSGERYVVVPQFDLHHAFQDSSCLTPIVFINSAGSDPMSDLLRFADTMQMAKKLDKVSLGQGQGRKAEELIAHARETGQWVLLQNCHLATSWMPVLEATVEGFTPETVKSDFRLWLTSMPSASFPIAVLQSAVKMTNEPPMGLQANVLRCYNGLTNDDLEHGDHPAAFKKLTFALGLFHGVIQERRKFGSLGFNIAYEFNDSDRSVCLLQLRKFLSLYDEIPYDVLRFLTGEINYGGRVTDDWDRRCLMTLIRHFLCPQVLEDGYCFSSSGEYRTIEAGNQSYYLDYIKSWPLNPSPEVFGLGENADITSAQNTTQHVLSGVLSLVSQGGGGGSEAAQNREVLLLRTALELEAKLPDAFDEAEFASKYPTSYEESMNTVLVQEAGRYNRLLHRIRASLLDFSRAIRGEVVMSAELEAVGTSFVVNGIPASWGALAYPSLKPLSSWMDDLVRRVQFIADWFAHGVPPVFWIGGFFFPQAFLTGTLQNYARRARQAIDTISFNFVLQSGVDVHKIAEVQRPEKGAFIYGLYLEGARWDETTQSLAESRPKELYGEVPVIHLDPVVNRVPNPSHYICPVYKTLARAGTLSTTGHSTNFVLSIELPTNVESAHWVERGVACVVSLNY